VRTGGETAGPSTALRSGSHKDYKGLADVTFYATARNVTSSNARDTKVLPIPLSNGSAFMFVA
jgi:hypothetical protein